MDTATRQASHAWHLLPMDRDTGRWQEVAATMPLESPVRLRHHLVRVICALAICAAVLACTPAAVEWTPPTREQVLKILNERIARGGGVGLVAGMMDGDRAIVVAAGVRTAGGPSTGAGQGTPVDERTVFEIGSVSKVFTTMALAEMAERGDVALDDPVQKFLPSSVRMPSRNGREITLLDLATAASGLPRMPTNFAPKDPTNPYASYEAADLYAFLSGYTLPRDPGASYLYSNVGMGLLGHALALRAGTSYEELVVSRVLKPLGMNDTRITLTPDMRARLAPGHRGDLAPTPNWDIAVLAGAGAWRSTVPDMLRFAAAAVRAPSGPLGRAFDVTMTPRLEAGRAGMQIGLGWHLLEREGRRVAWHNGETGGYHAILAVNRATGANAVVLGNAATNIDDIGLHLVDGSIPIRHPAPAREAVKVPAETLERYVGRYELSPSFAIEITRQGDALFGQATGQPRFQLFAASPTRFFLRAVEAEIGFTVDPSGAVTGLVLYQDGRETPGRKMAR